MSKLRPLAVLGLALILPFAAPAATAPDRDAGQPVAIAATDAVAQSTLSTQSTEVARPSERSPEKRSEVRGRRSLDPALGYRNPYAFPLQTVPIAVPTVTGFSF